MQEVKETSGRYTWEDTLEKLSDDRQAVLEEAIERTGRAIQSYESGEMDIKTFVAGLFMMAYECPELCLMMAEMIKSDEVELSADIFQKLSNGVLIAKEESEEIA